MTYKVEQVLFFIFGALGIGLIFYEPVWLSSTFNTPLDYDSYTLGVGCGIVICTLIDLLFKRR
jgi:hypothetical protein